MKLITKKYIFRIDIICQHNNDLIFTDDLRKNYALAFVSFMNARTKNLNS